MIKSYFVYFSLFINTYIHALGYYYFQDKAERSLNSLEENPTSPFFRYSSPRTGSRGKALERDKQLLQNLVSYYLTFPSSSSSSSSSVQPASRYRGAPAESFGLASSFPELDFPRDYDPNYVSQIERLSKQPLSNVMPKYDALAGLDGEKCPMDSSFCPNNVMRVKKVILGLGENKWITRN